jgi:CheY-like chemotaxis protein
VNHFLLVDDSDNDFFLLQHALQKSRMPAVLHRAIGIEEAMEYLQQGADNEIELPCAVLCDVWLHDSTACKLVEWIRQQPSLKDMAVLIWSGSKPAEDCRLRDLGITTVINKPSDHADFVTILEALQAICDERKDSSMPPA